MVTVLGWLAVIAAAMAGVPAGLAALACAGRGDKPGASAALVAFLAACCAAACALAATGVLAPLAGDGLAAAAALSALVVIYKDEREPWDAVKAAAAVVRNTWRPAKDEAPPDEFTARRQRKEAEVAELREAVPDPPPSGVIPPSAGKGKPSMAMPPPPPPPEGPPQGPPAGSPPPPGGMPPGSVADIFTAVQQIIMRADAEGMPGTHRAIKMFAEMHEYLSRAEHAFAQRRSEPDKGYPPQVWEPLARMAAHSRASSLAAGESDQALAALARMPLGDVAVSPLRSPHHNELNAFT